MYILYLIAYGTQGGRVDCLGILAATPRVCKIDAMPVAILDAVRYVVLHGERSRATAAFVAWLEKKLGVTIVYDRRTVPFDREDLIEAFTLASTLIQAGIVDSYHPFATQPDEPPLTAWRAYTRQGVQPSGGGAWRKDNAALMAALAEALERYLWREAGDTSRPQTASSREMLRRRIAHVPPARFASFSKTERGADQKRVFDDDTPFQWITGVSLTSGAHVWLPAQTVMGSRSFATEPLIRSRNTTGLATGRSQDGARLAGLLECIERDAWMTLWLNHLTLPRLDLPSLEAKNRGFADLLAACVRYRLHPHAIRMPTDAPTEAVLMVVEDVSGQAPRFVAGLGAHQSTVRATEKALIEALRIRRSTRTHSTDTTETAPVKPQDVLHNNRARYYAREENASKLAFLIAGPIEKPVSAAWEEDTDAAHLTRLLTWCHSEEYECVTVPFTHSRKNPTALHVEMVVMPDLSPMHLDEQERMTGGVRLRTVPRKLGIATPAELFVAEPHPFV